MAAQPSERPVPRIVRALLSGWASCQANRPTEIANQTMAKARCSMNGIVSQEWVVDNRTRLHLIDAMPKFHAVPAADLELLRKFDTPTVCNVIELFEHRPATSGYMDGR